MYRERAGSGSKAEIGAVDRKRINDVLDKHLEKSPPSASRGLNSKEKDRMLVPSTSSGKQPEPRSLLKSKCSDGKMSLQSLFYFVLSILKMVLEMCSCLINFFYSQYLFRFVIQLHIFLFGTKVNCGIYIR